MNCTMLLDLCPRFHRSPTKLCPDLVSFACWIVPEFLPFGHKSVPRLGRSRSKLCPNFGRSRAGLCPISFAPCPFPNLAGTLRLAVKIEPTPYTTAHTSSVTSSVAMALTWQPDVQLFYRNECQRYCKTLNVRVGVSRQLENREI